VSDVYGDSCENLLEILAVEIILRSISSVCGNSVLPTATMIIDRERDIELYIEREGESESERARERAREREI